MATAIISGDSAGGDLTGTYPSPTLANAGAGAQGPIGDSTHVAAITLDAKGRVSAISSVAIAGASSSDLDYTEFTADVAVTATTEATATTIVTASSISFDGATKVEIKFFCPSLVFSTSSVLTHLTLFEDGVSLGDLAQFKVSSGVNQFGAINVLRRRTPSNASHTYSVRGYSASALTATYKAGAGGAGLLLPGAITISRL